MALHVNDVLEGSSIGPLDKEISNTLYGLRSSGALPTLEKNNDTRGFIFFTRPQLNLTTTNIRTIRQLYPLLSKEERSIQRYVRTTLDPRLLTGVTGPGSNLYGDIKISCPLVDAGNAFIPLLSNTITSLTGWPDLVTPTHTTTAGLRKEQQTFVDGTYEKFDSFDLSATFENFRGEPLSLMLQVWLMYPSLVFEGLLTPYTDLIATNEFDYNTRIYRFIMDSTNTYIKKAAAIGAGFPNSAPTGKFFDFDRNKPFSEQTGNINVNFKCDGAMYFDDIVLKEFNIVQTYFNKGIEDYLIDPDSSSMEKVPRELLPELESRCYPIVNLDTYELEWLINKNSLAYKRLMKTTDADDGIDIADDVNEDPYNGDTLRDYLGI